MYRWFKRSSKCRANFYGLYINTCFYGLSKYPGITRSTNSDKTTVFHARPDGRFIEIKCNLWRKITAWKVSKHRVFSGPYFPVSSPTILYIIIVRIFPVSVYNSAQNNNTTSDFAKSTLQRQSLGIVGWHVAKKMSQQLLIRRQDYTNRQILIGAQKIKALSSV